MRSGLGSSGFHPRRFVTGSIGSPVPVLRFGRVAYRLPALRVGAPLRRGRSARLAPSAERGVHPGSSHRRTVAGDDGSEVLNNLLIGENTLNHHLRRGLGEAVIVIHLSVVSGRLIPVLAGGRWEAPAGRSGDDRRVVL
jgi:hypothetical protein